MIPIDLKTLGAIGFVVAGYLAVSAFAWKKDEDRSRQVIFALIVAITSGILILIGYNIL